jgi:uncharacterized protein (DUF433 family)
MGTGHFLAVTPKAWPTAGLLLRAASQEAIRIFSHMATPVSAAHPRITCDFQICHGQPVVRGLRYPVWQVLELLASGMSEAEILADYADLEAEDFRACQAYAAFILKKIGRVYETSGLTEAEVATGHAPRESLTKEQFLARLKAMRETPNNTDSSLK